MKTLTNRIYKTYRKRLNSRKKIENAIGEKFQQPNYEYVFRLGFGNLHIFPDKLLHKNYLPKCKGANLKYNDIPDVKAKPISVFDTFLLMNHTKETPHLTSKRRTKKPNCFMMKSFKNHQTNVTEKISKVKDELKNTATKITRVGAVNTRVNVNSGRVNANNPNNVNNANNPNNPNIVNNADKKLSAFMELLLKVYQKIQKKYMIQLTEKIKRKIKKDYILSLIKKINNKIRRKYMMNLIKKSNSIPAMNFLIEYLNSLNKQSKNKINLQPLINYIRLKMNNQTNQVNRTNRTNNMFDNAKKTLIQFLKNENIPINNITNLKESDLSRLLEILTTAIFNDKSTISQL